MYQRLLGAMGYLDALLLIKASLRSLSLIDGLPNIFNLLEFFKSLTSSFFIIEHGCGINV